MCMLRSPEAAAPPAHGRPALLSVAGGSPRTCSPLIAERARDGPIVRSGRPASRGPRAAGELHSTPAGPRSVASGRATSCRPLPPPTRHASRAARGRPVQRSTSDGILAGWPFHPGAIPLPPSCVPSLAPTMCWSTPPCVPDTRLTGRAGSPAPRGWWFVRAAAKRSRECSAHARRTGHQSCHRAATRGWWVVACLEGAKCC